jgi:2-oxoglutarate dehydrogenase E1 component
MYSCVCCAAGKPDGSPAKPLWGLHEAVEIMADTYCGTLSLEYKHLQQQDEMAWMQQRFESRRPLTGIQKRQVRCSPTSRNLGITGKATVHSACQRACLRLCPQVLRWLLAAQGFEQFLSRKFPASKRFGLEGCEALLPGLLALVEAGADLGLRKVRCAERMLWCDVLCCPPCMQHCMCWAPNS